MMNTVKSPRSRKVAVLADNGFSEALTGVLEQLEQSGIIAEIVSTKLGVISGEAGSQLEVQRSLLNSDSVLFDAVLVAGGRQSVDELLANPKSLDFVKEAFQHYKPIGAMAEGAELLLEPSSPGVVVAPAEQDSPLFAEELIEAIAEHRYWSRVV